MSKWMIRVWVGLFFCGVTQAQAQQTGEPPSLRVLCNILVAEIRVVGRLSPGEKRRVENGGLVMLQQGERYTLIVTRAGFTPFRQTFSANWSGERDKRVVLEKGIGPAAGLKWVAELEDGVKMEFMPIPAGRFMMGSDQGEDDELPVHEVVFKRPMWMAKTEVTYRQYEQFKKVNHTHGKNELKMPTGADVPVCWVSWTEARDFCKWLTKKEREWGRLPEGYEYTLPTEAEWEYACRAGSTGSHAGPLDALAWYKKNSGRKINLVGQKKPNAWGLHDMHGNVWEWCADYWYGSYTNAPTDGSQRGDAPNEYDVDRSRLDEAGVVRRWRSTAHRVVRGGSWLHAGSACRSANRYYHTPDYKLHYLGFRPILLWNPPILRLKATERFEGQPTPPITKPAEQDAP